MGGAEAGAGAGAGADIAGHRWTGATHHGRGLSTDRRRRLEEGQHWQSV